MIQENQMADIKLTPMLAQWMDAKKKYSDSILLFRMGDFYELFAEDAEMAAPILDLALTSRDKTKSAIKMAGFPFHASQAYIAKLVESGFKVAICEQLEDPKTKKGIVKRGVTELFTPATFIEKENLFGEPNYLVSLFCKDSMYALAALDLTGSNFITTSCDDLNYFLDEVQRLKPKEIIFQKNSSLINLIFEKLSSLKNKEARADYVELEAFLPKSQHEYLNFTEKTAVNILEIYLNSLHGKLPAYMGEPRKYSIKEQLLMDDSTRTNLNLFPEAKGDKNNLLSMLLETKTVMGKRFLHNLLLAPSTSLQEIKANQNVVEEFFLNMDLRDSFRKDISACHDLEKLVALVNNGKITPKSLALLRDSLLVICSVKENYRHYKFVSSLLDKIDDLKPILQKLSQSLVEDPPINIKDGNIFLAGYDENLDEIYSLSKGSQDKLLLIEKEERQKTGIPSLKVRYTRVFGYYIEITNTHLDKVPERYFRKQTIANGERFVTSELNELEVLINSASEKILEKETFLFEELVKEVSFYSAKIINAAKVLAYMDCMASFAYTAAVRNWVKPEVLEKTECKLDIKAARHPIIEHLSLMQGFSFVPNDMSLSASDCMIALITGPNMAGKSTIMRQIALIQVLAQMGCYVPAQKAQLSICDAIFARVGASDNLALGRSTFMVEMKETSQILSQATQYSLILLDEIGRGTSTYDGLSIAQSVAEYIHNIKESRTLFATHYHELTKLETTLTKLKNFYVEVEEKNNEVKFIYTLKKGFLGKSFGILVAKLAGIPEDVLKRAESILYALETNSNENNDLEEKKVFSYVQKPQLTLFTESANDSSLVQKDALFTLARKINALDVNKTTPLVALNKINEWQKLLKNV